MWFVHWMTQMIAGLASPELVWSCCANNRLLSIVQGRSRWSVTDVWACSGSPGANVDKKVFRACSLKKDWLLGVWPFGTQMATCGLYRACQKGSNCLQKGYHQARLQGQRTTSWAHCYCVYFLTRCPHSHIADPPQSCCKPQKASTSCNIPSLLSTEKA